MISQSEHRERMVRHFVQQLSTRYAADSALQKFNNDHLEGMRLFGWETAELLRADALRLAKDEMRKPGWATQ